MAEVGLTEIEAPVPTKLPPHGPLYQRQTAPAPKDPPLTLNVELPPRQIVGTEFVMLAAALEFVRILTSTDLATLVPHEFAAVTEI